MNTNNLWGKTLNFPVGALYRALLMFPLYQEQSQFENYTKSLLYFINLYTQTVEYKLDQASFLVGLHVPKPGKYLSFPFDTAMPLLDSGSVPGLYLRMLTTFVFMLKN